MESVVLPVEGRIGKGNLLGQILTVISVAFWVATAHSAESKPNWQTEWERTVKAAEEEGQLTVYVSGYGALIDSGAFQKSYPKIKVTSVTGSGTQLAPRIVAERRGEKYLADVYSGGGTSLYQNLYLGKMLDPIKPALILPEVIDPSKWWEGKQKYVDREGRYIFAFRRQRGGGCESGLQHQSDQSSGLQVLMGFSESQVERQDCFPTFEKCAGPACRCSIFTITRTSDLSSFGVSTEKWT